MRNGQMCLAAVLVIPLATLSLSLAQDNKGTRQASGQFREVLLKYESTDAAIPTQLPLVGTFDQMLCDDSGAVYLRPMLNLDNGAFANPVVRIEKNGSTRAFGANDVPGMRREVYIFGYTVDPSGRVFELIRTVDDTADEMFLVSFSKTGDFLSKSRFESEFRPFAFTALPTGDFLISGVRQNRDKRTHESIVGVFGSDAVLKRSIKGEKDDRFVPISSPSGTSVTVQNPAIELGSAKVGPDGSVYVLKSSDPARIEVFDVTGLHLRTLTLTPPFPKGQSHDLFVTGNSIIVMYQRPKDSTNVSDPVEFAEYDLQTGEPLVAYLPRGKGVVACFDSSDATVLVGGKDGRFGILRVPIRQ